MDFVSYAQNFEDVMLWRALGAIDAGFYIDVGANDPEADSVTNAFYLKGWHGINVEPVPDCLDRLRRLRPRDINLGVAVAETPGRCVLHMTMPSGLSTLDPALAAANRRAGLAAGDMEVEATTLAAICREHVTGDVHFLKIDVEGAEKAVLEGADFTACRPWIVLVEATQPNSPEPSHAAWEPILTDADYQFVWFDGLNRFYVAGERHTALARYFQTPPNVFDRFVRAHEVASPVSVRSDDVFEAAMPEMMDNEARTQMAIRCRDADPLPKVPFAGEVAVLPDGTRVQTMHNGLRVVADGYYGPWMTDLIRRCRGHHEPQEERLFHEVMRVLADGGTMIELGGYWAFYSAWFLRGGADRHAVVVEPDAAHRAVGEANMALNGLAAEFVAAYASPAPVAPGPFQTETSGVQLLPGVSVMQLMEERGISRLDVLHCDAQGIEFDVLESCLPLFAAGRIGWLFLSTHAHQISGDPLIHQRCLALVRKAGLVVEAEHDVHESFSGDGLIVARGGPAPRGWMPVTLTHNRYAESLFRNPAYDLVRARASGPDRARIEATVAAVYETVLIRSADPVGLALHADMLEETGDVRALLESFLHSDEFAQRTEAFLHHHLGQRSDSGAGPLRRAGDWFELRHDGPLGRAGDPLLLTDDRVMAPAVRMTGAWNPELAGFVADRMAPAEGAVLVDIGANIGLFTRQLLHMRPDLRQIICVEPDAANHAALRFNLAPFSDREIAFQRLGLGDADGQMDFYRDRANSGNFSFNPDAMRHSSFETVQVKMAATGPWMRRTLADVARIIWKSDTQGNDEFIVAETPWDIWERVEVAVIELWRIDKGRVTPEGFLERIAHFPNLSLGLDRPVTVAEIADYLAADDHLHDDLLLWR